VFGRVGSVLCACVDVVAGEGISFLLTCLAGALLPWSLTPPPLFSPLPSPQALASFLFKAECVRESCVCRVHGKTTTKQKQKTRASRAIDDDDECRSAELGCAPKKSSNTPAVCFAPQDARWIHRKWSIRDLGPSASLPRARAAAAGLGRAAQAKRRAATPQWGPPESSPLWLLSARAGRAAVSAPHRARLRRDVRSRHILLWPRSAVRAPPRRRAYSGRRPKALPAHQSTELVSLLHAHSVSDPPRSPPPLLPLTRNNSATLHTSPQTQLHRQHTH
jgi:hypothetical protein